MDSFRHSVSIYGGGQATRQQCWFASYKMLLRPSGKHKTLESTLRSALKKDANGNDRFDDAMANGLLDTDFKTCAAALQLSNWSGSKFNKEAGFWDIGLTDGAEAFIEILKKGPLWVSRYIKPSYHIVLATGYNDDGKGYIIHNNPYPGPKDAVEITNMSANMFVKFITNASGSVQRASS